MALDADAVAGSSGMDKENWRPLNDATLPTNGWLPLPFDLWLF